MEQQPQIPPAPPSEVPNEPEDTRTLITYLRRELEIEAALERVRARSLSMHHSEELEQVALTLFDQLVALGFTLTGTLIFLFDKDKRDISLWIATTQLSAPTKIDLPYDREVENNAILKDLWKAIETGEHLFNKSYSGETKNEYFRYVQKYNDSKIPEPIKKVEIESESWTSYLVAERNSVLGFDSWSGSIPTITDQDFQILLRFARVFEQAYIRFLDLQKAEAQAREAIRQASLDRVRAEIASMRSAEDLQRITPLVWHELTTLGVPFIRCGVFILDQARQLMRTYLSAPDGHSLTSMELPFGASETIIQAEAHWRRSEVYKTHWDKEQFVQWMESLVEEQRLQSSSEFLGDSLPPESLYLHFIPFRQGMLYVGSEAVLSDDEIDLVGSLAAAFSIAYARYDDFKQLEEAKAQVEATLDELRATQAQLIQSEKMASLGELTAGIAHEIQNPLNFVNNYSEVNVELLEELRQEFKNGDPDEVEQIINDLSENEAKIHHHGRRADSIVRGMLQHSRTHSGTREPTDLNALADEYLRLAYHGLRAKDNNFQAEYFTDFDPGLPKVEVVPADMGRALLNIINNAF